jgi:hypothetical protein
MLRSANMSCGARPVMPRRTGGKVSDGHGATTTSTNQYRTHVASL